MSIRTETVTRYFASCDWCKTEVEVQQVRDHWGLQFELPVHLPTQWIRDYWDKENEDSESLIYCSQVHMERARQVAELRALP